MILLDTDHISHFQEAGEKGGKIRDRLRLLGLSAHPPTTIITYEEQIRGWMGRLAKARTIADEIGVYAKLKSQRDYASTLTIVDFTPAAATEFQRLRNGQIRIGTLDLKIAAIALSHDATLWTCNYQHFSKVPGLRFLDATI